MGKGFTLIELLIVIGILAILATVAVLVINPAELLAQARDSQRVSDLDIITSGINLYLVTVTSPNLNFSTTDSECRSTADSAACQSRYSLCSTTSTSTVPRVVDGTGWVDVKFTDIPGGSPVAGLPLDPTNNATYFYSYCSHAVNKTYELTANLESARYVENGGSDLESKDGGNAGGFYERGNKLDI